MAEDAGKLIAFLGVKAYRVVSALPDPELRGRVITAIEVCTHALGVVDSLDLSPHELSDPETANVDTWEALAPDTSRVLVEVRQAGDRLAQLFPPGEVDPDEVSASDLERAFDLMAGAAPGDAPGGSLLRREQGIDLLVRSSNEASMAHVGESIRGMVAVLHQDIAVLGGKLRNPNIVGDRWFLLAELHQFLGQCSHCLEAVVATVLNALSAEHLDDLLPRYADATSRAVMLRAAVTDLAHDVEELNQAIARASKEDLAVLKGALADSMTAFAEQPAYRYLKPQDKRPIITFRVSLGLWEKQGSDPVRLRQQVEGFSRFLSLMCDLNWREELAEHDARFLESARVVLASEMDLDLAVPYLKRVRGRSPIIDQSLRALERGGVPPRDELLQAVVEAGQRLGVDWADQIPG
ncbi:MAG: hypothetical protein IT384_32105 [Deltaproteobacteria bacterium]|nr:hypothetical protein [Deltaproteobacteria bacterium]